MHKLLVSLLSKLNKRNYRVGISFTHRRKYRYRIAGPDNEILKRVFSINLILERSPIHLPHCIGAIHQYEGELGKNACFCRDSYFKARWEEKNHLPHCIYLRKEYKDLALPRSTCFCDSNFLEATANLGIAIDLTIAKHKELTEAALDVLALAALEGKDNE